MSIEIKKEDELEVKLNEMADDIVHVVLKAKNKEVYMFNEHGEQMYTEEAKNKFEFYKNLLRKQYENKPTEII